MKLSDTVLFGIRNLTHRQLRSWLTVIGIVIGIMSVIALISISEGLNKGISDQLAALGGRTVIVMPGGDGGGTGGSFLLRSGTLTENDAGRVKKVAGVDQLSKAVGGMASIEYKDRGITSIVRGVEPSLFDIMNLDLEKGRFFTASDRKVVIIGSSVAENAFGRNKKVDVGSVLRIGGANYRVVGVLKKSGSTFYPIDSIVFIPYEDGKEMMKGVIGDKELVAMFFTVKNGFDINDVAGDVETALAAAHGVKTDEEDFRMLTPDKINQQIGIITDLLALFLGIIGSISIVVGGIGVANTMFMNVLERSREIGVLKSIGATRGEILQIFLVESGIIGIVGGLVGVILAVVLLTIAAQFGAPVLIRPELLLFALVFSLAIGLVSGAMPARQAARVPAVEALRYE